MNLKRIAVASAMAGLMGLTTARAQVVNAPQVVPAVTPTPAQIPFGPVLDVVPYVNADGYTVQMSIVPTLTEFLGYDTEFAQTFQTVVGNQPVQPTPLPAFRVRQVVTSAMVWDGQTIVLGGLIAENVTKVKDKVPIIGDIPLLGRLFRSEATRAEKKNLMIFVTPTIIDPAGNRIFDKNNLPYDPNTIPSQPVTSSAVPMSTTSGSTTTTTTTTTTLPASTPSPAPR